MKTQTSKRAGAEFFTDIEAPVEEIFPLACPVAELEWIDNWDFTMVYSDSGRNEPGCIFIEEMSALHLAGPRFGRKTYWITTRHDPAAHVVHFLLARTTTLTSLAVTMDGLGAGTTRVNWNMMMTSISEEANEYIRRNGERQDDVHAHVSRTIAETLLRNRKKAAYSRITRTYHEGKGNHEHHVFKNGY